MSEHPVFVTVQRADGSQEQVRVGTAHKEGNGFRLELGALSIGGSAVAPSAPRAAPASSGGGGGMVFPNYGRSKGAPIAGASAGDLEFYAGGCRRTLSDPGKARWHDKERELLAAIEAEMGRQGLGGGGGGESPRSGPRGGSASSREEPPPMDDEDIPF